MVTKREEMPPGAREATLPLAVGLLLFAPIDLIGNAIGSVLRYPDLGSAVLFPPYAALTAVLVASRRRHWGWYILAGALAHLVTHWPQWPLSWVLLADVANVARALTAAALLRRLFGGPPRLDSLRALWLFVLSAVVVAPAVGATLGAANVLWHGAAATYWSPWSGWLVSNALTGLTMLPALLPLFAYAAAGRFRVEREPAVEALLLAVVLSATCAVVFLGSPGGSYPALLLYAPLPVLIWAALRFGAGGASLALTAVVFAAIGSVERGTGPFHAARPDDNIFALQAFALLTTAPVLCLAVLATARRHAEREIEEQRRELSHLARVAVLGQLSGAIAHELNQPLAAILSNAEAARQLLHRHPADLEELDDILRDIAADDQRAAAVIHRLRALLRRGDRQLQAIDGRELVREVLELARTELMTRQVDATAVVEPGPLSFYGDRVQMQQVLLNLILNGCEAMSATAASDRRLVLTAGTDATGNVCFAVRDHGTGIPPELGERLFEPFVTTKPDGLGLGLSISQTIVAAHGGRLWAENNPGGGATLCCLLPVMGPPDRAPNPTPPPRLVATRDP